MAGDRLCSKVLRYQSEIAYGLSSGHVTDDVM